MRLFPIFLGALLVPALLVGSAAQAAGKESKTASYGETPNDLIDHPYPQYPFEARSKLLQGTGSYLITFERNTGVVRDVKIVQSTGSTILDEAAVASLRRWRAKPHTLHKISVPITFSLEGKKEQQILRLAGGNVLESPYPKFPLSVRWEYPSGKGLFRLAIDRKSGLVTSVQVLRTMGDNRLDAATLKALHEWRFKPQTLSQLVVPIEF